MEPNQIDFTKRTFAVVTGASRGIGRKIAVELSSRLSEPSSVILLVSRSEKGLNSTKAMIHHENASITVNIKAMDLSKPVLREYTQLIAENICNAENAIIFHNAGSLGVLDKTTELNDVEAWHTFFDLNVISASLLNSAFMQSARDHAKKIYVVNISSLCGSQAFKHMGMYGSGKAARNLFFRALATEDEDIAVLNYSPGPVNTDMVSEIVTSMKDEEIRSMFVNMRANETILSAEKTVNKLLEILKEGKYKSGELIDYYDRVEPE